VRRGQCQFRDAVPPTPVRLTHRALEGGAGCTLEPFSRDSAGSSRDVRTAGAPSPSLSVLCGHPHPCSTMPGTATTTPALLGMRERDAATPATVPRTDHRQRLPRARVETPRPTTMPPPSKPPLFKYRASHDVVTGARLARTTANSPTLYAIPPHVAKQCGMPVITLSLVYKRKVLPLAAKVEDITHGTTGHNHSRAPRTPTILALASITPPGTWRPRLLSRLACSRPTTGTPVQSNTMPRAHPCWTYGPGRNQDKPSVFSCLEPTIEG
jgi:hypothetical protein